MTAIHVRSQWSIREELVNNLKQEMKALGIQLQWEPVELGHLEASADQFPPGSLTLIKGDLCYQLREVVTRKTANSHFSGHVDCIENYSGQLWGSSLLGQSFEQSFLRLRKLRPLKGRVLFLGSSPLATPLVELLSRMGFNEFSFLKPGKEFEQAKKQCQTLIGVDIKKIESTDLIQSSKEYSLCFVLEKDYPESTLSDLSYFHFLSVRSLVLEMTSASNFPFSEVKALGTEVISIDELRKDQIGIIASKIKNLAKHLK